jgi:hypothetical protein
MRPSILLGNRKENRVLEKIGIFVMKIFSPLFLGRLKKIKPIHSEKVAKVMLIVAQNDFKQIIFESNQIVEINKS